MRPVVNPPRSHFEWWLQALAALVTVAWLIAGANAWSELPARVPVHFGFDGVPNAWGNKHALLMLPALGLSLYVGLSLLELFPRLYNYPVAVTEQNAAALYRLGRETVAGTKLIVTSALGFAFSMSERAAHGEPTRAGALLAPGLLAALLILVGTSFARMRRAARA